MKSLIVFSLVLLNEIGERCGISTTQDCKTLLRRVEHEGVSFLTITLPAFCADFQKSLAVGQLDPHLFQSFAKQAGLPRFLGGFLGHVFDRGTGRLLDDPCVQCISAIRQFTLAFGKIELPCSESRVAAAYAGYIECEQVVREYDAKLKGSPEMEAFRRIAAMLWADLLSEMDRKVYYGELLPSHGSGSTADKLKGNLKWNQREWPERLEEYFPAGEYLFTRYAEFLSAQVDYLEPGRERPVKVITVPKTLKTPRIIALEPTCMQYVQHALMSGFAECYRTFDRARAFICYDSQEPNRLLARQSSISGELATLDLSEASDRVSNQLVRALMSDHPHLSGGVQACRSRKADVLGKTHRLAKFASMGSALTFPIEAMVFCTIVFVGIERGLRRQLTLEDVNALKGKVRVYGDDIIVPVDYVPAVIDSLSSFGMKVNEGKSFWTGKFRESCGGDYYDGTDVTPVRVRSVFPTSLAHADEIVSTVALRNHLFERGYLSTVEYLDALLGRVLPVYPEVPRRSRALGRWSFGPIQPERFHRTLHVPLVRACVSVAELPPSKLEDNGALMKWFLTRGDHPFEDKDHLLRAGRPRSVSIKTRWVPTVVYGRDGD